MGPKRIKAGLLPENEDFKRRRCHDAGSDFVMNEQKRIQKEQVEPLLWKDTEVCETTSRIHNETVYSDFHIYYFWTALQIN
jgi:hypothetical protein